MAISRLGSSSHAQPGIWHHISAVGGQCREYCIWAVVMAVVRMAGWQIDADTGQEVFRVVVEYRKEDAPPDFPIDIVWKETPVEIVVTDGRP